MKARTCFVSNSSSSSFVVHDASSEEVKEKVIQCCRDFILNAMSLRERMHRGTVEGAEVQARRFVENPDNVLFLDIGGRIGRHKYDQMLKNVAEYSYSDANAVKENLEEDYAFPDSPERIALMVDAENAFIREFGWGDGRNDNAETSIMEAIEDAIGARPVRLT